MKRTLSLRFILLTTVIGYSGLFTGISQPVVGQTRSSVFQLSDLKASDSSLINAHSLQLVQESGELEVIVQDNSSEDQSNEILDELIVSGDFWSKGLDYLKQEQWQEALEAFQQSLFFAEKATQKLNFADFAVALAYQGIGKAYLGLEEWELAIESYEKALKSYILSVEVTQLLSQFNAKPNLSQILFETGIAYQKLEKYDKALLFYESSAILPNDEEQFFRAFNALNEVRTNIKSGSSNSLEKHQKLMQLRQYFCKQSSLCTLNEMVEFLSAIIEASYKHNLGVDTFLEESFLNLILSLLTELNDLQTRYSKLFLLSRIYAEKHRKITEAIGAINLAISDIEEIRNSIDSSEQRSTFFASVQNIYESKIYLHAFLLSQPENSKETAYHYTQIFNTIEKTRTRTLNEAISSDNDISDYEQKHSEVNIELKNLKNLQKELRQIERRFSSLLLTSQSISGNISSLEEYNEIHQKIDKIIGNVQKQNPLYAEYIRASTPLEFTGTRIAYTTSDGCLSFLGLGEDSDFLQYYVGEKLSLLLRIEGSYCKPGEVSQADFGITGLPSSDKIEKKAKEFYTLLKQNRSKSDIRKVGACLRDMILPTDFLENNKRLVISADGILNQIPFAALPLPDESEKSNSNQNPCDYEVDRKTQEYIPLVTEYEISNIPSASAISIVRQQERKPAPKTLALFADPVFSSEDPRITEKKTLECKNELVSVPSQDVVLKESNLSPSLQVFRSFSNGVFSLLPCIRFEAESILNFITDPNQKLVALDFDATQEWVEESPLSDYRILHFATHGFAYDEVPFFSGLLMSLFDPQGNPMVDSEKGILNLREIYQLKLNADLVVLSACETALGENRPGEGIVGLTRGFMVAGAEKVMSSLWKVEDSSTAQLMEKFYNHYLNQGLPPSTALQQAQIEMINDGKRPYQWASFVIHGDWH